jgi:hypothetical protein
MLELDNAEVGLVVASVVVVEEVVKTETRTLG